MGNNDEMTHRELIKMVHELNERLTGVIRNLYVLSTERSTLDTHRSMQRTNIPWHHNQHQNPMHRERYVRQMEPQFAQPIRGTNQMPMFMELVITDDDNNTRTLIEPERGFLYDAINIVSDLQYVPMPFIAGIAGGAIPTNNATLIKCTFSNGAVKYNSAYTPPRATSGVVKEEESIKTHPGYTAVEDAVGVLREALDGIGLKLVNYETESTEDLEKVFDDVDEESGARILFYNGNIKLDTVAVVSEDKVTEKVPNGMTAILGYVYIKTHGGFMKCAAISGEVGYLLSLNTDSELLKDILEIIYKRAADDSLIGMELPITAYVECRPE